MTNIKVYFYVGISIVLIMGIFLTFQYIISINEEQQNKCIWIDNTTSMIIFDEYTVDTSDVQNHPNYNFKLNGQLIALLRGDMETEIKEDEYCYGFQIASLHYPYNENGTWVWR